jgi:hypothetical protein
MYRSGLYLLNNFFTKDHTVDFSFDFKLYRVFNLDFLFVGKLRRDCWHMLDSLSATEHAAVDDLLCFQCLFCLFE